MNFRRLRSDQLDTWSDINTERTDFRIAKTPQSSPAQTAPTQGDPPRLPHRALQTMWHTGMQVRRRPRPWPQVLSVGELPGLAAANGLCAAGISCSDCRVRRQLSPSPRDLRGDLRDQPRVAAPPGGALNRRHEPSAFRPACAYRCRIGRCASRQYGRSLARRQPRLFAKHGGSR